MITVARKKRIRWPHFFIFRGHLEQFHTPLYGTLLPKTVVFTTPADPNNVKEAIDVMRLIRNSFPSSTLFASFHRGIKADDKTTKQQSKPLVKMARAAKKLGFKVRDVSYELKKIEFYQNADLHIGYRVHAHLEFVSRRSTSILICEDGRGFGQVATLQGKNAVLWAGAKNLLINLDKRITHELKEEWPSLHASIKVIDAQYPVMKNSILEMAGIDKQ